MQKKCEASEFCITVKKFLSDGNEFVKGDVILRHDGKVLVSDESMIDWNIIDDDDHKRYVLRAAAIENQKPIPKPEVVEWKNGDALYHNHHAYEINPKITYVGKHPFISGKSYCISDMDGIVVVDDCYISNEKPESPEEKEQRERLEAAYDLYCHVQSIQNQAAATFELFTKVQGIMTIHRERYLAIVDKTNYRKGE